jgi:hypothetical protein
MASVRATTKDSIPALPFANAAFALNENRKFALPRGKLHNGEGTWFPSGICGDLRAHNRRTVSRTDQSAPSAATSFRLAEPKISERLMIRLIARPSPSPPLM